ncbi:MAG: alpha/beta fold hydrolase [Verrucomicrobiales bacterium]|nr:alpha/beta fold hydrolase [Verrucomicrobiales bacterium]
MRSFGPFLILVVTLVGQCGGRCRAAESVSEDLRPAARTGDIRLPNFVFRQGGSLPELRVRYATWGSPAKDPAGRIVNAVVLLHGTGGTGIGFGGPHTTSTPPHPLLGKGAPLDANRYFIVAPDAIGSGSSSKPSDGLRMQFPAYDLSDMVRATYQLLGHLEVHHVLAVIGVSMGGREAWQFAVQYPDFMDAIVPMIASPFPNAGRRALVDLLPQAVILGDPRFAEGNYSNNPPAVQWANQVYGLLGNGADGWQNIYPSREAARHAILGTAPSPRVDACDFLYQLRLNDGFDAWSQIDRVKARVLMINMADDELVPIELGHNRSAAKRLRGAQYLELAATGYGHGGLMRTVDQWGSKLGRWLRILAARHRRQ